MAIETFINSWSLKDPSICDDLIKYFKASKNKQPGRFGYEGGYGKGTYDKKIKDSTDIPVRDSSSPVIQKYLEQLSQVLELYKDKYKFIDEAASWNLLFPFTIKHYKPKQGYHRWHYERAGLPTCNRMLVFMTYLNDVTKGGQTEWYYQKVKIKPKKGLTVFWPTDFNFTHRGVPSLTKHKYIVSGWFVYDGSKEVTLPVNTVINNNYA